MRSFGTHDGSFHADEVTACSLLLLFGKIEREKVRRTREPALLETCEYVCDVGGVYDPSKKRFDHHQATYQGTMSSAGMVLLYLRDQRVIDGHMYDMYNKCLVLGVDAHDNGLTKTFEPGVTTFSQVVSNFMPIEYGCSAEEMNGAFFRAVDFVMGHLDRMRKRAAYAAGCREEVRQRMEEGSYALVFDRSIPWMDSFFDMGGDVHPAQFLIMPSGPTQWKLRGIPPSLRERMQVRRPLPEKWAGLQDEALRKVTGIRGAVFCHKGRFISIWETREDAEKALHLALEK